MKAKSKGKKAAVIKDKSKAEKTTTVIGGGGAGKKKDKELEELDMKRKALVCGNKWADRIQALDVEVSFALEQAEGIESCEEFRRFILSNDFVFVCCSCGWVINTCLSSHVNSANRLYLASLQAAWHSQEPI